MEEQNIRDLLAKCAGGYIPSAEEQKLFEDWYDAFPEHNELTFACPLDKYRLRDEIKQGIFKQIGEAMPVPETEFVQRKRFVIPEIVTRVAVALVILILIGGAWIYFSKEDKTPLIKYITVTPADKENLIPLPDSSAVHPEAH